MLPLVVRRSVATASQPEVLAMDAAYIAIPYLGKYITSRNVFYLHKQVMCNMCHYAMLGNVASWSIPDNTSLVVLHAEGGGVRLRDGAAGDNRLPCSLSTMWQHEAAS